jgi:hypothetical protein
MLTLGLHARTTTRTARCSRDDAESEHLSARKILRRTARPCGRRSGSLHRDAEGHRSCHLNIENIATEAGRRAIAFLAYHDPADWSAEPHALRGDARERASPARTVMTGGGRVSTDPSSS